MSAAQARERVRELVDAIDPWDERGADRADVLAWIDRGDEIFRTASPDVPPQHLVSYFVLVDRATEMVLLVDHRNAQLWIPTGGHVEPGEDPAETVRREADEELGIASPLLDGLASNPLFVTRTATVGLDGGHVDVSLWFVVDAEVAQPLRPDPGEFHAVEWWPFDQVFTETRIDPELTRFMAKLRRELATRTTPVR